jgi:hypothetical protein
VGISMDLPITYMPFKFENRRVRIDWRLLHGVDIDKLVSGRSSLSGRVTHSLWAVLNEHDCWSSGCDMC